MTSSSADITRGASSGDYAPKYISNVGGSGSVSGADVAGYSGKLLWEQVLAVVPVCSFLALFQVAVIGQGIPHASELMMGLVLAICGLALFTFGLINGLMPMGERLGKQLPLVLSMPALLVVSGSLGVAVTLAEPALGVVKTAGSLIRKEQAPHLFVLLHEQTDLLVLAVAIGVGISAALGLLRIRWNRDLKGTVLVVLAVTLVLSSFVHFSETRADVLGLAWDLGAVTTGPVTVPLVIALGMGVASAGANPSPLTGFGVVTLASLIPVNLVILLSLVLPSPTTMTGGAAANATAEAAAKAAARASEAAAWFEQTPGLEIVAGVRALVPLVAFMGFLLVVVLKDSRPLSVSIDVGKRRSIVFPAKLGIAVAQVGIIVFNIGLTQGLAQLGTLVGASLPAAFAHIPAVPASPLMARQTGIGVACAFAWVLGFGATLAEPGLFTLAVTVEKLSKGAMSQRQVVLSVALGVGTGTAIGLLKVILQWELMPLLLPAYALAAVLTIPAPELLVNIAWDSAGVTTGPVTVPLVISLGLGLGKGIGAADGFGILSLASVFPVITVLAVGLIRKRGGCGGSKQKTYQLAQIGPRATDGSDDDGAVGYEEA